MAWWKIFKNVDVGEVVNQGMKGIDAAFFTNEEKAHYNSEVVKAHTEYIRATLDENTSRSTSRRSIAHLIVITYLTLVIAGIIVYPFMPEYGGFILTNVKALLGTAFVAVVGFYFGSHLIRTSIAKYREKKEKEK